MIESSTTDKAPREEIVPIISGRVNVADYLEAQVELQPCKRAVIVPAGRDKKHGQNLYVHVTFSQLLDLANRYAWGLHEEIHGACSCCAGCFACQYNG